MSPASHPDHEAIIEAMLLAAAADGEISKVELEVIFARIFSRPEFSRYEKNHLRETVEKCALRLGKARSLNALCESLAERLETITGRELAFRCAAAVAMADHGADSRELAALKALQAAFGLTDARVQSLFELASSEIPEVPR